MIFTDAYAACTVCSPTRASILTGKYPARLNLTNWITGQHYPYAKLKIPEWKMYLPLEEITIADVLKKHGYATSCIGKWHLGGESHSPDKQGFDHVIAGSHHGLPYTYFAPYVVPMPPGAKDGEYLTDRLAEEAVKFIEANKENPFLLFLSHYSVHTPLQSKE